MAASAVQSSEDERLTWDEIEKVVNADVVRSVMTSRVLSIGPDASVFDAMKLLVDNRISAVPVVDGDRQVLGVVSEYDLMARVGKKEVTKSVQDDGMFPRVGRCDEYNGNVKEMWSQFHNLQERMSKASGSKVTAAMHDATTCVPDMRLVDATELMLRDNLARLPVVDEQGRLVGILSRGDIMRRTFQAFMLAQQSVNQEEFARSVMALDASDPAINTQINTNAALDAFCDATPDDDECRIYED
jgi:CBS domain-containing protein